MLIKGSTDIGKVRTANEDGFDFGSFDDGTAWAIVCDGMGGVRGGHIASSMAIEMIGDKIRKCYNKLMPVFSFENIFLSTITTANVIVNDRSYSDTDLQGMGTTIVSAIVKDNQACLAHVGDSRIYTVDHRDILQVSRDHSYVQYLVDTGEITYEEAKRHPKSNVITRAIGIGDDIEPDVDTFPLSGEECAMTHVFLCTDGFSGSLDEDDCMKRINDPAKNVEEKATELVAHIKEIDGSDNITLVLIDLGDIAHGKL